MIITYNAGTATFDQLSANPFVSEIIFYNQSLPEPVKPSSISASTVLQQQIVEVNTLHHKTLSCEVFPCTLR